MDRDPVVLGRRGDDEEMDGEERDDEEMDDEKLRNLINRACEEGISKADSEQIDSEIEKPMFPAKSSESPMKRTRYESQSASSGSHQTYRPPSP